MATYYVDSINGNDSNSGLSELTAWKTLNKMVTALGIGGGGSAKNHTVLLKRGSVFTERMTLYFGGLSNEQPFTIDAYGSGAKPIINFAAGGQVRGISVASTCLGFFVWKNFSIIGTGPGVEYGILYQATNPTDPINLTLDGVDVYDIYDTNNPASDRNGIMLRGDKITIQNCSIYNIATDGIWISSDSFTIKNNLIYNVALDGRPAGDCIQVTGVVNNFLIEGNTLDHTSSSIKQCLVLSSSVTWGSGGIVRNNIMRMKPSSSGEASYALYCEQPACQIYGNMIYGGNSSATYPVVSITSQATGLKFFNNIVTNSISGSHSVAIDANNVECYNNTISSIDNSGSGSGIRNPNARTGLKVKNNIVINHGRGIEYSPTSTIEESNNCLFNTPLDVTFTTGVAQSNGVGTITSDPLLDSNYLPANGSPVIGGGIKYWGTSARPSSFSGEPLPDIGIDIGAVQTTNNAFHPKNIK